MLVGGKGKKNQLLFSPECHMIKCFSRDPVAVRRGVGESSQLNSLSALKFNSC